MSVRLHHGRRFSWLLGRPLYCAALGVHIARQEPGGKAAQRDDRCWRNAAGLYVNTRQGYLFVMIRNVRPKERS